MIKKLCIGLLFAVMTSVALAQDSFIVSDVRVKGLQRISAGSIFNYLPIKVGDQFDPTMSADLIRELYKTGFFKNIELNTDGTAIIVEVIEYPSIATIEFAGNKLIKEEALREALSNNDFIEGRVFQPNVLEQVKQELKRQYLNQGKYNAQVGTEVTDLPRNRVKVKLHVKEGPTAKIQNINIIGNKYFSDEMLLDEFELSDSVPFWKFWGKEDQYSKEKVSGDLESLRSFYQDQGFLDFQITSNQVSISPQKDGIFLTINVEEGERYTVSQFVLNGRLVVPEDELLPYVFIAPGRTYSRKDVDNTVEVISDRLAEEGYSYAQVVPVPDIDREARTVAFSINIKPGRRVYVRRIDIIGNDLTNDSVIRREMRQTEGGAFSPSRVNRSKIRLQRLSFFDEVEIETNPVAGRDDQVDLQVIVKERPTGSFLFGLGYSGDNGALVQASISQANLFGTGNQLNFNVQRSSFVEAVTLQYTNPYYTKSGISRTIGLSGRSIDSAAANTSEYITETLGLNVRYLFPINENNSFSLGAGLERIDLETTVFTVSNIREFIDENPENDLITLSTAFVHDTRDSLLYPTAGNEFRVSLDATAPGSDLEYYRVNVDASTYFPFTQRAALKLAADIGYGDGYGDTDELPFFKNYFAGGSRTVRGYEARSLGPRDDSVNQDPLGGSKRVLLNASLLLPVGGDSLDKRLQLFVDAGQVYGPEESFDSSEIRVTAGVGFNWISPVGPLSISYSIPLNEEEGDEIEKFQFSVGQLIQ
ncbi:outer membrane protein assembly factor BamA [Arenicella xantha]|uniref:Outer membrane protein assembly factor BamA n=1 Tax=Arenicella xantha TaxID=644221 RepID=A0A395JJT1_9GAMM|nr:outer membrane protein assembly factor BamA [Arenicella xantha]RBP50941.1 Beta-barrel assembly machine subunit BamA [Arenicella xantha]